MTDIELDTLKTVLDLQLASVHPDAGVKFGLTVFSGFARRGWFTLEQFPAFGPGSLPVELPAYDRTRFAVADPFLGDETISLT